MPIQVNRRAFLGALSALGCLPAAEGQGRDGWVELFDGHSLANWRPGGSRTSWKVSGGQIAADGPRSTLFYNAPEASFRNFELEVEALAQPGCDAGVWFHTAYQAGGSPGKGFEIRIHNTPDRENRKTGSLDGLRHVYRQFVADGEWFTLRAAVRGKNIQVRLNGMTVVDYTEPTPAIVTPGMPPGRMLDRGTFALASQAGPRALFRKVRARRLPDQIETPGTAPVVDALYRRIVELAARNYPMADCHTHIKGTLTLEQMVARSLRDGIGYGIAINCGKGFTVENDAGARAFAASLQGQPVFIAMQAEGREWTQMFSRPAAAVFDYIFTDSMTWTDNHGRRMRTWIPEEVGTIADPQEFMDTLVDRAVGILEGEPVDIYANPTYLPDAIARDYETLWTGARRKRVIAAAVKNGVAIELNNRYRIPSASFIRMAKAAGAKFSFGSNNAGADDLRRCEYGIQMIEECGLESQDFFVPGKAPKAVERKGAALRG